MARIICLRMCLFSAIQDCRALFTITSILDAGFSIVVFKTSADEEHCNDMNALNGCLKRH